MTAQSVAALMAAMFILSAVPGPSDFAVVARSVSHGLRQALLMILGIVVADCVLILLAIYSMATLAEALDDLFHFAAYACGAFMLWLGIKTLLAARRTGELPKPTVNDSRSSVLAGFLITMGDPKALLFYMGFFPAFIDLRQISILQTAVVMLIATIVICSVKGIYALLAERAFRFLGSSRLKRAFSIAAGCIFIGTGLYLLWR